MVVANISPETLGEIVHYINYGTVVGPVEHFEQFKAATEWLGIGAVWPEEYKMGMYALNGEDPQTLQTWEGWPWQGIQCTRQLPAVEDKESTFPETSQSSEKVFGVPPPPASNAVSGNPQEKTQQLLPTKRFLKKHSVNKFAIPCTTTRLARIPAILQKKTGEIPSFSFKIPARLTKKQKEKPGCARSTLPQKSQPASKQVPVFLSPSPVRQFQLHSSIINASQIWKRGCSQAQPISMEYSGK